ncbi:MFS transporter [Phascolarctobacterium faecium]|uniref:MFS transporter n=1 Tax=Phascolarctobacterium faecium TaxID=33025 RepID=UPI003AEF4426
MNDKVKNKLIITIAGMGMLLSTLDTGIINVALPFLENQFHTSTSVAALSVTGYTMSLAIFILPFGYLSDRYGKLKLSLIGLLLFGVGSVLCGLANNMIALISFRILQGIGAAGLQATSAALITTLIEPKHVPSALGILGIMIGLGPVLGPSIGGLFLALHLWRLIFWINVPFAALGLICNYFLIKNVSEQQKVAPFDLWGGSVINALSVVSLLSGFSLLSNRRNLIPGVVLIAISLLFALMLYIMETKRNFALIDFKGLNATPKSWLYLLQTVVFGFASAGLVIFSKVSGKYNDGHQNTGFSLLGLSIIAVALAGLCIANQYWPALAITLLLFIYGVGSGFFQPANIAAIMQVGDQASQGSLGSLQRMVQNIAIASGTAIGSTVLNLFSGRLATSIQINWGITLAMVVVTLLLSIIFKRSVAATNYC